MPSHPTLLLRFAPYALACLLPAAFAAAPNATPSRPATDEVVRLDPFDVTSGQTDRYQASTTISGTAMNMPLKDVPMTINVITAEFLDDAVTGSLERALDFNASVTQTTRGEVNNQNALFSLRGFRNRNILLDGVMGGDFIPRHLVDRIEVVKGPNTLYGQSDPGGLVNMISKRPRARDHVHLNARHGSFATTGADLDVNLARVAPNLGLRLLGSHETTDGFRWLDGTDASFAALSAEWRPRPATRLRLMGSASGRGGQPSNRAARPFVQVPTDLNGDGDTLDRVGGVTEATARFNADFVPIEYTAQTRNSDLRQTANYVQFGAQHSLTAAADLQYTYMWAEQENDVTFREFNTFTPAGVNTALYQTTYNRNTENAHTLNALIRARTGAVRHTLIAGARNTLSKRVPDGYQLRPGTPAERTALNALETGGRVFRHTLTRTALLSGAEIWRDDAPSRDELRRTGFRQNQNDRSYEEVTTFYVSDSAALLDDRLRVLAGLRRFEIKGWSYQRNGSGGAKRTNRDLSHQLGVNYALSRTLVAFASHATAYNPNGFDVDTNAYFAPEESTALEAGLKLDGLWGGRLSGSVAWFRIDKDNVVRSDYNPFASRNTTEISDDRSEGVDVELFLNLGAGWQTTVSYTHLNARTVRTQTEALGMALEGAAPDRLTFFTSYAIGRGPAKGLRLGGGAIKAWGPIQQFGTSDSRLVREDGYTQVNLFARYATEILGRASTFGLNVSNLTDAYFIRARANSSTPREVTTSVGLKF
jgi:iron complex outermembrane receptor protein